jgi:hypothetical protein
MGRLLTQYAGGRKMSEETIQDVKGMVTVITIQIPAETFIENSFGSLARESPCIIIHGLFWSNITCVLDNIMEKNTKSGVLLLLIQ